jgi:catechol 2,3-dioxygenase-like lactoylglutathione lyase family enzyme
MRNRILILFCAASAFWSGAACAANEQPIIRTGTRPAEFIMTKITVSNLRKSYDFYTKTLGLKEVPIAALPKPAIDDPEVAFTEVALNFSGSMADAHLVLVKQKCRMPAPESARLTWIGIKVADVRAAVKQAEAAGFSIEVQPKPVFGLLIALVRDPDGYLVELLEGQSVEK